jgi:hypothetical protein
MDFTNPKTWADGIATVVNAPHIVFPLLCALAAAVWWARGVVERSAKAGLRSQIGALKEQVGALNERLSLARDQEAHVTRALNAVKAQAMAFQVNAAESLTEPITLEARANAVVQAVTTANSTAEVLHRILRAETGRFTVTTGNDNRDTPLPPKK